VVVANVPVPVPPAVKTTSAGLARIKPEICRRAAGLEPAIVFPDYIFGQINEGRHLPGTIYTAAKEIEDAGGKALPLIVDVRDETSVRDAVEKTAAVFGGIEPPGLRLGHPASLPAV